MTFSVLRSLLADPGKGIVVRPNTNREHIRNSIPRKDPMRESREPEHDPKSLKKYVR